MDKGWQSLATASWTVRAETSHQAWNQVPEALRAQLGAGISATVPGCVHTDLLAAGLIEDPYLGQAEAEQHWIGAQAWTYAASFELADDDPALTERHCELSCDGLDTVADVYCNGHLLGHSENMHRRNIFDIKRALVSGANTIEIVFTPALEYTTRLAERVGERVHVERG